MVVSLYVCEIPSDVTKSDIETLFSEIEGYIETRTKEANDKRTIAFIDYQGTDDARCARDTLQGFKFTDKDKGLIIKISDNTKNGVSQGSNRGPQRKSLNLNNSWGGNKEKFSRKKRKRSHSRSVSDSISDNPHDIRNSPDGNINAVNQDYNSSNNLLIDAINMVNNSNKMNQISHSPNQIKNDLDKYDNFFRYHKAQTREETNIVYVEGIPYGVTEREVSHIFRPFPGFQNIRLITRLKNGEKTLICFIDFENTIQSTVCINTLQGYRFDKSDLVGLRFSYGVSKYKK